MPRKASYIIKKAALHIAAPNPLRRRYRRGIWSSVSTHATFEEAWKEFNLLNSCGGFYECAIFYRGYRVAKFDEAGVAVDLRTQGQAQIIHSGEER